MRRAAAGCFHLAREQHRDGGKHKHRPDHRKGVAETHHQCLLLDRLAERDNGLLARRGRIRHAVGDEKICQLRNAAANFLAMFVYLSSGAQVYTPVQLHGWFREAGFSPPRRLSILRIPGQAMYVAKKTG